MASYQTLALVRVTRHIYSHIAGSRSCYGICIYQPSSLLVFPLAFSQAHWFYHGTPLAIEPWHSHEPGIFILAGTLAFAHIPLEAGHIPCSLVLLSPLHGMQTLRFYFSIVFFIRFTCIDSIYSVSHFSFTFIILSACFITLAI